jgi:glucose/arabinose dehydrogenase
VTYPVAQFDHDEAQAISGGHVYRGTALPVLQGTYVFGDIPTGRLFYLDADAVQPGRQVAVLELGLLSGGKPTSFRALVGEGRVDLHVGAGAGGELYFLTKHDGVIWKVTRAVREEAAPAGR